MTEYEKKFLNKQNNVHSARKKPCEKINYDYGVIFSTLKIL